MPQAAIGKAKPFIVLTGLHILSACIVLINEFLSINNRVPGGNYPIEMHASWTKVLLFCGMAIVSGFVLWIFITQKRLTLFPSPQFTAVLAVFATLISTLVSYLGATGWCCEVYPIRYFGFPFSYLQGDSLLTANLILNTRVLHYRLYFPYQFFLDFLFWSNTVVIVLGLASFWREKMTTASEDRKNVGVVGHLHMERISMDRVMRLFLAVFFGVIAGIVAFLFPAGPTETPIPISTTPTPTFTSTSIPISTPSQRLLMLASANTPMLELPSASTPTSVTLTEATCPPMQPAGAAIGQIAMVRLDPSIPSQVREQPDVQSAVLGQMQTGEFFIILDGPQCTDDYVWWKVQSARGLLGWVTEGYVSSYWLVTPTSVSTKLIDTPTPPSVSSLAPAEGLLSPTSVSVAQLYRILRSDDTPISVAWSPDGMRLVAGDGGGGGAGTGLNLGIHIWDWTQGQQVFEVGIGENSISSVDWSPNGKRIAVGEAVQVRDSSNGELETWMDTSAGNCLYVKWSPNGLLIAGGCNDGSVLIWDATTGEQLRRLDAHATPVTSVSWSPDGHQLASSSHDGTLRIWDVTSGIQVNMFKNEADCHGIPCGIGGIDWSPDGKQIAFGSDNLEVETWDPTTGQLRFIGHHVCDASYSQYQYAIAWSPDGRSFVSTNQRCIQVWGLADELSSYILDSEDVGTTLGAAWSPDGKYLAVAGKSSSAVYGGSVWIWSIP